VEISETTDDTQSEGTQSGPEKPVRVLPWYFDENSRGEWRVGPAKLLMYIREKERYFWVASGAMDGVRRYFYNDRRGVYEWLSDDRIKGRIRSYISSELPTAVKAKDINETFNLLILDECRYSDSAIDSGEHLVNFENGYYDIYTGQMIPHSSSILSTIQLSLRFDPTRNYTLDDAPNFKQYITTITEGDTEKQTLLLEYMGAALSNVPGYKFKSALFLVGAGNTGKSKYIELIYSLLGEGNFASISFADLEERFQSGAIYGKRLVCDADMKVQRAKGNSLFMKITGGDPVQIEYKGMNPFTTKHRGFLLFASNAMPRWSGNTTDAAYNRMMIIECNNVIPPERQDPDLLNKLLSERGVIVSLALNALRGAVQRGYKFTRPATMTASINKLRRDNCPSIDFFEACCEEFDDANCNYKHCMKRSVMHRVFVEWCRINAPSAYIPSARDFYHDILQYKQLPDGSLIKIWHGHRYYTFTLTLDAKEQFHIPDNVNT
jgi:P4 family phage/plasmid primase-like protien